MSDIFKDIEAMQQHMHQLEINGLRGRMMRIPATKKSKANNEIMMIYGHHASLERIYGVAEDMSQYGNVTVPDLPGFGGMDSFFKIGMKPTIDNLADYLATFVKLRYRGKKVTIMGMSLGFVIATRMLQRYPELVKKVHLNISVVGFARYDDFNQPKSRLRIYKVVAWIFKFRITAAFFYNVCLNPTLLRLVYAKTPNARSKFEHLTPEESKKAMDFEVILWRDNDVRTYMHTALSMLSIDNCNKQVKLPVHHIAVDNDQYFDNAVVEQHMRIIYEDFTEHVAVLPNHAPSVVANKEEAAPFVPKSIRKLLNKRWDKK